MREYGLGQIQFILTTTFIIFLFTENLRSQFQPYFCLADEKVDGEKDGLLTFEELDSQISQVCNFFSLMNDNYQLTKCTSSSLSNF